MNVQYKKLRRNGTEMIFNVIVNGAGTGFNVTVNMKKNFVEIVNKARGFRERIKTGKSVKWHSPATKMILQAI